ncbi:dTDP-4-dehydrorhamnose 3,5-epimerase [Parapedobacter sp. 2B3]|uniref:dTDP-4-dehydrorhamnose 3,5-epimerase n=1 Tax=Parapedobacter sp. 2B3 TaxID=3342381 RepID=UPI0035B5DC48
MTATETHLDGCFILNPTVFPDERGHFFESFNEARFQEMTNTNTRFVQDNQSFSKRGVIRALHAQAGEYAQAKLVRVLHGEVLDVAVDARPESTTFGQHIALKLSAENRLQLFIPRGFLHGFVSLSETAVFFYKCDNYYNKESESGVLYSDPSLAIDWLLPDRELIITNKDKDLPLFEDVYKSIQ